MLFNMAFRNIKRNKRRSILAIVSVCIALTGVVVFQGLVDGMVDNIIKNSTKNETGHIRIANKEYFKNIEYTPVDYLVSNYTEVVKKIESIPEVRNNITLITERFRFPVLAEFGRNNKVGLCFAGDVDKEKELIMLNRSIVEGKYLSNNLIKEGNDKYREVIVGKKVAEALGLKVGDSFSIIVSGNNLNVRRSKLRVVGIFSTGLNALDDNVLMISIKDAKEILSSGDATQEIILMVKHYNDATWIADRINKEFSSDERFSYLKAVDWRNSGGFVGLLEQSVKIYNFIYFVIVLLGAFIIMSIMMMVILERRREIGILKSMGLSNGKILVLFTLEGTILGSIGTVLGIVLGVLINIPLSIWGIDFSSSLSNMNFPMDNVIKWSITFGSLFGALVLGVIVSSIISIIPSRHAAKMKPIDAIKNL
ncbi:MAG: ABC transporter permease [Brevinematia bacterium]